MIYNSILLQAAAQPEGNYSGLIMIVVLIAIFYFFMIRPQNKHQKKIREERAKLEKGSKVFTQGGIYGKVAEVKETVFVVEIAPNVKITVDKNCVFPANDAEEAIKNNPQ